MGSLLVGMEFQHILRLLNTNVDGKEKIMYALTSIKGIGRRFANICCKKAEVDMKKRAGGSAMVHYLPSLPCRTFAACTTVCFHILNSRTPCNLQASARLRSWSA